MTALEDQLEQLDREALEHNAQLDTVLKCISTPLQWLNYDLDSTCSTSQQLALVRHGAWKRHVWLVIKDLVPRWTFALSSVKHRPLVEATLCLKKHTDRNLAYTMARVSLPILVESVSIQQDHTLLDTLTLYASLLQGHSLDAKLFQLYAHYTPKTDIVFFCNLLCSIPGHLANVFGIQLDQVMFNAEHAWYMDRNFYAKLSKRITEQIDCVEFTQALISKITRQGYEDMLVRTMYPVARSSPGAWSAVLQPSFEQVTKALFRYIIKDILLHTSIHKVAKELHNVLFGSTASQLLIEEFLEIAFIRTSKTDWANDSLARLAICTIMYTQGFQGHEISETSNALVLKYAKRMISIWSDPTFVKHGTSREHITCVVLCLIAYMPDDMIRYTILTQTSLFPGVSNYFNSADKGTAQLGAVMAEAISGRTGDPVHTGLLDNFPGMQQLKALASTADLFTEIKEDHVTVQQDTLDEESENELQDEFDPDALYCPDDEEEEEESDDEFQAYQMEEESDDEGMKKEQTSKKAMKTPVYVRDLIGYLKDHDDPLKLELGLNAAQQVIRQRSAAGGSELSESAERLAGYLITVPETFDFENCTTLQQEALIALIVSVPEDATKYIINELYDRNTSSGQKQLILGAIALAVRELSGWSTPSTTTATNDKQVEAVQSIGNTVFLSRRMQVEKQQQQSIHKNRLSGLAGSVFFFPLLVGWWEGAQGRIKYWIGNNKLLTERFIMTLNIILHSSTNIPDKRRIVKEYFEFASSMRYNASFGVKKALLLGLDTIINTSYKGQEALLFQDYTRELSETKDWLEEIMEHQTEKELQEIAVQVLMRLSQIALTAS